MTQKPSKRVIKKHMKRLVSTWRTANDLAWSTVGRPGPVFFDTEPGPDKDQAWEEHGKALEADQAAAGELYRRALQEAPAWLKEDKRLVEKCFYKAFVHDGCAAIGPGILGPKS